MGCFSCCSVADDDDIGRRKKHDDAYVPIPAQGYLNVNCFRIVWRNWLQDTQQQNLFKLSPQTASPTTHIGNVPTILVYNNSAVKGTYVGLQKFGGNRCTPESVASALCQSDPELNEGHGGSDSSRDNVIEGVRRKFIEKVLAQHEEREEEDSD